MRGLALANHGPLVKTALRWLGALSVLTLLACQPAGQTPRSPSSGGATPGDQAVAPAQPVAKKTLVIGGGRDHLSESDFGENFSDAEISDLLGAGLFRKNALTFAADPWMVEESPSIEKGTWTVNPDGTMVTRYRLRPNVKWHDGTPLTTQDWLFGWELTKDPKMAHGNPEVGRAISRMEAPDDRTLVFYWNQPFNRADAIMRSRLGAHPRHILEEAYRSGETTRIMESPQWTTQFVGSGPYKIVRWDISQEIEMEAFNDYFLGRPKIDRIIWKHIFDVNTMLSNVLSNGVDAALRQAFTVDTGLVAKDQWEARGEGQVIFTGVNLDWVALNTLNPWLRDIRLRRAMLHAINRDDISENLSRGYEPVAHMPLSPKRPQFDRAQAVVTRYPYDPTRAQALMTEAGWNRGPDGVLVNSQGERLVIDGRTGTQEFQVQLQSAVIDYWKRIGVEVQINNLTARQESSEEYRGRFSGAKWAWQSFAVELYRRFYGNDNIPTAEKRWVGNNEARWDDSQKESILIEMDQTFDNRRRDDLVVEFNRLYSEQLPHLPLKYQAEVMSVRKGIMNLHPRNELGGENTRTWNAEQWDMQ
jgi:peptide/nickel transport system substrate-binding protein